jgi:hypothetical protein
MIPTEIRFFIAALALLLFVQTAVFADYLTQIFNLVDPGEQSQNVAFPGGRAPGTVQIEAYDGNGANGGGLNPGEVRLIFDTKNTGFAPLSVNTANNLIGVQAVAFNTDLSLSPSQIHVPTGWMVAQNFTNYSASTDRETPSSFFLGQFSWGAGTVSSIQGAMSILITGLGANATLNHFVFDSTLMQNPPPGPIFESAAFAANAVGLSFGADGANVSSGWLATNANGASADGEGPWQTPEPTTLALASVGLVGLLGRRVLLRGARGRS